MGKLIPALMFATVLASGCKASHEVDAHSAWSRLKRGDYLRADYVTSLCKSRSPLKAWREVESKNDSGLSQVTVSEDRGALSVSMGWNFHEGSDIYTPDPDGALRAVNTTFFIEPVGNNEFVLSDGKSKILFKFVGDWQRWSNSVVIAGDYTDARGRKYFFDPDGNALFPDNQRFDYEVGLDMVLSNYDYIYSKKAKATWSLKSTPQGIALYDVDLSGDDPEGVVAPKPRWTLQRRASSPCP
jgi:hypothetical protein